MVILNSRNRSRHFPGSQLDRFSNLFAIAMVCCYQCYQHLHAFRNQQSNLIYLNIVETIFILNFSSTVRTFDL